MHRREFLQRSFGTLSAAEFASSLPAQTAASAPPNIIWLLGDQHRAQALSCAGDPNARTPNLDDLSSTGSRFRNAVSGFPLCCPFRGSMLTGRYPHECVPGHEYPLPKGQETIAKPFRDAGYHTAYFGKWHLDGFHEREGRAAFHIVPPERRGGFETWVGYENNNSQWDCWVHGGAGKDAFHYRLPGYETDELTKLFIKYIRDRGEEKKSGRTKPFFAVLSVQPPHNPYQAPAEYMSHYNPARLSLRPNVPPIAPVRETARRDLAGYYAMIENWDANIGRIRDTLDEIDLAFNTHIFVFSDHGDMHGSHGMSRKTNPFEEATRIPMIIGGRPGYHPGSAPLPTLFSQVDIAPTTLALCKIPRPEWMHGTDYSHYRLLPGGARRGPAPNEPDSAYLQNVIPTGHPDSINKPYRGLITRDGWKYVCFENMSWLLFNLNEDPYELSNLADNSRYRADRHKLIARLRQWVADTGDKFQIPDD
jgi:arylsulfatase A-like enzyme